MAKAPESTEASRIAALEEWSRGTAEFMESVNERLGALEEAYTGLMEDKAMCLNELADVQTKLADVGHVSRATAENAPIDGDVFARIKRLEAHAGLKDARTADEAGS